MTIQDTLETAGPDIIALIGSGRAVMQGEADRRAREEAVRLAQGEAMGMAHWISLQKHVEELLPRCLLPYANTHQEIMPEGLVSWTQWDSKGDGCWQLCNGFKLLISAPGCVDIEGRFSFSDGVWKQVQYMHKFDSAWWTVRAHDIWRDDDGDEPGWKVCEDREDARDSADRLDVALAKAAKNYEIRNGLYRQCEERNKAPTTRGCKQGCREVCRDWQAHD